MVRYRSVDGYRFEEGWSRDRVEVEIWTDGLLQPIRLEIARKNVGLAMVRAILEVMK